MRRIILIAMLVGCGSDDDTSSGPISEAAAEAPCTQLCERDVECEGDVLEDCVGDCVVDLAGWARTDAVTTIYSCISQLECDADEEAECGPTVAPLDVHRAYEDRCRVTLGTCLESSELDSLCEVDYIEDADGDAGVMRFLAPIVVEAMTACLVDDASCDDQLACIDDVFEQYGVSF